MPAADATLDAFLDRYRAFVRALVQRVRTEAPSKVPAWAESLHAEHGER